MPRATPAKASAKSAPKGASPVAAILREAAMRLEQFDFGSALNMYRNVLATEPGNAAAAMGLAMTYNRTGKPSEALQLLQKVWKAVSLAKPKPGPAQQAAVLAQLGLAQQLLGKLGESLESYRQAARLVRSDDLTRRIKQLEPLVSSPAPVQQLILQARQLQGQRQLEEAAKTFRAALQLQQDSAEALHGLALVLRELKSPDEAMPLLQKAVMLAPNRPEFFNDMGLLFQDRSDFAKAVSFHKRAVKVDPSFLFAYINMGVAHKRLGQLDDSVAAYRKALQINPNSPEAHNNLGNLLRTMGKLAEAKTHIEKALGLRPNYPDAKANLEMTIKALAEEKAAPAVAPVKKGAGATKKVAVKAPAVAKKVAPKAVAKTAPAKKVVAQKPVATKAAAKAPAKKAPVKKARGR